MRKGTFKTTNISGSLFSSAIRSNHSFQQSASGGHCIEWLDVKEKSMFPRNRFPRSFPSSSLFILLVWCTASAAQTAIKMKLTAV